MIFGGQCGNAISDHLARILNIDAGAAADNQHERVRAQRSSFIYGTKVILDIFPALLLCARGKHSTTADARYMQTGIPHQAHASIEARLLDLVPP